mmetsp:Transcript_43557/g.113423  ORF Transcript_43557/g.113423 Transcript_43557/m.113423 type:complete len:249 (-) Transcript_43557:381-1127(-)
MLREVSGLHAYSESHSAGTSSGRGTPSSSISYVSHSSLIRRRRASVEHASFTASFIVLPPPPSLSGLMPMSSGGVSAVNIRSGTNTTSCWYGDPYPSGTPSPLLATGVLELAAPSFSPSSPLPSPPSSPTSLPASPSAGGAAAAAAGRAAFSLSRMARVRLEVWRRAKREGKKLFAIPYSPAHAAFQRLFVFSRDKSSAAPGLPLRSAVDSFSLYKKYSFATRRHALPVSVSALSSAGMTPSADRKVA